MLHLTRLHLTRPKCVGQVGDALTRSLAVHVGEEVLARARAGPAGAGPSRLRAGLRARLDDPACLGEISPDLPQTRTLSPV